MPPSSGPAAPTSTTLTCFATRIYQAHALAPDDPALQALEAACLSLAEDDEAGQAWCEANAYLGYTSYASLNDLPWRMPPFAALVETLAPHVAAFAHIQGWDLRNGPLELDSLWVNILPEGAGHSGHIHPNSVVSGTIYVRVPEGASALRFEDPRLAMMMAAPPRRADADESLAAFRYVQPRQGDVLLWESWLRHEVPPNLAAAERISVSFNYRAR